MTGDRRRAMKYEWLTIWPRCSPSDFGAEPRTKDYRAVRRRWAGSWLRGAAALLVAVPGATAQRPPNAPVPSHALVLDRVTVIDVEHGARWRNQRVLIVGTRIRALGRRDSVRVPPGARLVDARGQYLIPGLWDTHTHPDANLPTAELIRHQVNAIYNQLVASGITGIRIPGSQTSLDSFRVWKREIAAGRRVGPRLIVSGPSINDSRIATANGCPAGAPSPPCDSAGRGPHGPALGQFGHVRLISDAAEARHLVDSLKAAGADILKFRDMPRSLWLALAREARRAGIPFGGHFLRYNNWGDLSPDTTLPQTVDGLIASDSGARILDHEIWAHVCGAPGDSVLSLPECTAAAARLRRNGTWVNVLGMGGDVLPHSEVRRALRYGSTTEAYNTGKAWRPLTAAERRQLPTGAELAAVVSDSARQGRGCQKARLRYAADLPWLPGDDFPWGSVLSTPMALLRTVLCGVPPLWALQGATLNPAKALGLSDSLGTVAAGKVADLVLLESDPLEDIWAISRIAGVFANGRYFDRAALDQLLIESSREWLQVRELEQRNAKP